MAGDRSMSNRSEGVLTNDEEVRIVMVGKYGVGKSTAGNTILGFEAFESGLTSGSLTLSCQKVRGVVDGRKVSVVDTPGLFDARFSEDETLTEIKKSVCFAAPGPHVFLNVIKLENFEEEEWKTLEMIQETFGQKSEDYTMILFTNSEQIEDETVEVFLKKSPEKLQELVSKCLGRYHVFSNKTKDPSQVTELLKKISSMVLKNGGSHYTTEMFQEAERVIEEEKQRILKENEENRRREVEELKKKHEGEDLEEAKKIINEQREQEAREKAETSNRLLTYEFLGGAAGAAMGAAAGANAMRGYGLYAAILGSVCGCCIGGKLGAEAAAAKAQSSGQAVAAGADAVANVGQTVKEHCVTQ